MRFAWILIAVVLAGCAATQACPSVPIPATARPLLWEVTSARGTLYLFGTHHAAAGRDVPREVSRLLASSDLFVAEVPEVTGTYDDSPAWRAALKLPPWRYLHDEVPPRDFARLVSRLDVERERIDKMRPWVALGLLIKGEFTFPDPNMPTALFEAARAAGLRMEFLDTLAHQRTFLDMIVGGRELTGALRTPRLGCSLTSEVDRYLAGDETAFATRGPSSTATAPGTTTTRSSAIAERERVWTDKLATYARSGQRVFVGIGVANIVGPRGIAARLAEYGFDVRRL